MSILNDPKITDNINNLIKKELKEVNTVYELMVLLTNYKECLKIIDNIVNTTNSTKK